jgi:hypothetical protein
MGRKIRRPHRRQAEEDTESWMTEDRARLQAIVNTCARLLQRGIQQVDCQVILDMTGAVPLRQESGPAPDPEADPLTGCLPVTAKNPRS